ncbi:MAG: HD domain-containing protein [Chitinophagaceae bacterium]
MNYHLLEENAETFVTKLFTSPPAPQYPYHNLKHTASVVEHAKEIGHFYKLTPQDISVLVIAAWFHDTGQLSGPMEGHEDKSRLIMFNFMSGFQIPDEIVAEAGNCILATKVNAMPANLVEKIICDADTYHFGTDYFMKTELLMKAEMELRTGEEFPHWHLNSIALLNKHVFYTEYCQLLLNEGKKKNTLWLKSCTDH